MRAHNISFCGRRLNRINGVKKPHYDVPRAVGIRRRINVHQWHSAVDFGGVP